MYTIETKGENVFALLKDNVVVGEFLTLEDAEKAKTTAEESDVVPASPPDPPATKTWVEDGAGLAYPKGTDGKHSGSVHLGGEERVNAILTILRDKHGFTFPLDIFDPETDTVY